MIPTIRMLALLGFGLLWLQFGLHLVFPLMCTQGVAFSDVVRVGIGYIGLFFLFAYWLVRAVGRACRLAVSS